MDIVLNGESRHIEPALTITGLLQSEGLAERRVSTTDRRVKEVWLTAEGCRRRAQGMAGFATPPEVLQALSDEDLETLAAILAKVEVPEPTS